MKLLDNIIKSSGLDQMDEILKTKRPSRGQLVQTQIRVTSALLKDAGIVIPAIAKPAKNFLVITLWKPKKCQPELSVLMWEQIREKKEKETWIKLL